jgi:hypothetical protein
MVSKLALSTVDTSLRVVAFNRGCQARIDGIPKSANPYPIGDRGTGWWWLQGWRDVDQYWGFSAGSDWRVRPLPEVKRIRGGTRG